MLKLIYGIIFCLITNASLAAYPEARDEYINDYASIIDNDVQTAIREKLRATEDNSGVEISVATIKSFREYNTGATSWEKFSTGLFNYWGVGNIEENNGVLLLISLKDRKIRIELGAGYPDHYNSIVKSIIDEDISPKLKIGQYSAGISKGVDRIIEVTTNPVSFFDWYKWYILAGVGAFISLLIGLSIDKQEKPGLFWVFLGMAGILILYIVRGVASGGLFSNDSDGFGGGSSDGGGASGDF